MPSASSWPAIAAGCRCRTTIVGGGLRRLRGVAPLLPDHHHGISVEAVRHRGRAAAQSLLAGIDIAARPNASRREIALGAPRRPRRNAAMRSSASLRDRPPRKRRRARAACCGSATSDTADLALPLVIAIRFDSPLGDQRRAGLARAGRKPGSLSRTAGDVRGQRVPHGLRRAPIPAAA